MWVPMLKHALIVAETMNTLKSGSFKVISVSLVTSRKTCTGKIMLLHLCDHPKKKVLDISYESMF